jgi:PAS domain-containing protein
MNRGNKWMYREKAKRIFRQRIREEYYRAIMEGAPATDEDGVVGVLVDMNPFYKTILGLKKNK